MLGETLICSLAVIGTPVIFRKGIINVLQVSENFVVVADAADVSVLAREQISDEPAVCIFIDNNQIRTTCAEIKRVQQLYKEIRIICLSDYETEYAIMQLILVGVNGYLPKSCSVQELNDAILAVREYGIYHSRMANKALRYLATMSNSKSALKFTTRETEFITLSTLDLTYKEIADKMNLSIKTVENYRDSLFTKLNIRSRVALAVYALKNGIAY